MPQDKTPAGTPQPARAEPLQPDRPGKGDKRAESPPAPSHDAAEQQRRQSEQALDNVREGYD